MGWNFRTTPRWSERTSWTTFPARTEFMDITPTWRTIAKFSTFACRRLGVRQDGASSALRRLFSIRWVISFLTDLASFVFLPAAKNQLIRPVRPRSFARKRKTPYPARSLRNSIAWTRRLARKWRKRKVTWNRRRKSRTWNQFRPDLQPGRRGSWTGRSRGISDFFSSKLNNNLVQNGLCVCVCL